MLIYLSAQFIVEEGSVTKCEYLFAPGVDIQIAWTDRPGINGKILSSSCKVYIGRMNVTSCCAL